MYLDVGEQERPIWYQTYHRNDIPWIVLGRIPSFGSEILIRHLMGRGVQM